MLRAINDLSRFSFSTCCYHAGRWRSLPWERCCSTCSYRPNWRELGFEEIAGLSQSKGEKAMRFLMALPAPPDIMEKIVPSLELVTAMRKYDQEMTKAGIMLAGEGLPPTSKGGRLRVSGGKRVITDGPFTEAKEVIAGFWMIQVKSKEEALEWAKRCPLPEGGILDIYQIFDPATDFPP